MAQYLTILLIGTLFLIVAELFGRSKHIGRWWSFILLLGGILPGVIAIITSPPVYKEPTKGSKLHVALGWFVLVVLGIIPLIFALISSDMLLGLEVSIAFIITGLYIVQLGNGKVVNRNPKEYFSFNSLNKFSGLLIGKIKYTEDKPSTPGLAPNRYSYLYYVVENSTQSEPLNFDQLKAKNITTKTLIWRKGLNEWVNAEELYELSDIITHLPPPLPNSDLIPNINDELVAKDELSKTRLNTYSDFTKLRGAKDTNKTSSSFQVKVIPLIKSLSDYYKTAVIVILVIALSVAVFLYFQNQSNSIETYNSDNAITHQILESEHNQAQAETKEQYLPEVENVNVSIKNTLPENYYLSADESALNYYDEVENYWWFREYSPWMDFESIKFKDSDRENKSFNRYGWNITYIEEIVDEMNLEYNKNARVYKREYRKLRPGEKSFEESMEEAIKEIHNQ